MQGVFYRASLIDEARRLGLTGWVRNRLDGSVEALAQGAPEAVQTLIDWAQRGPPRAQVSAVRVSPAPAQAGEGFEQRDTA
mgnify:CR=1 FL=1